MYALHAMTNNYEMPQHLGVALNDKQLQVLMELSEMISIRRLKIIYFIF